MRSGGGGLHLATEGDRAPMWAPRDDLVPSVPAAISKLPMKYYLLLSFLVAITHASTAATTPSAWRAASDPRTGREYYWNTATRESRWTKPEEMDAAPASDYQAFVTPTQPRITYKQKGIGARLGALADRLATGAERNLHPTWAIAKGIYLGGLLGFASAVL